MEAIRAYIIPFWVVRVVVAYVEFLNSVLHGVSKESYSVQRFGRVKAILLTLLLAHPERLSSFEWDLNSWTDSDVLAWKSSYLGGCNITAATSAIIAQVALTALSLLDLNDTHWTARALMTIATVTGIVSVLIASSQSIIVGRLNSAIEIRIWLSDQYNDSGFRNPSKVSENAEFPLRSSLAAQRLIELPFSLLTMAGACFLAGFGVYLGSAWANHLNTNIGSHDNRNVLIAFILATSLPVFFWTTWAVLKSRESEVIEPKFNFSMAFLLKPPLYASIQKNLKPLQDARNVLSTSLPAARRRPSPSGLTQPNHGSSVEMAEKPQDQSTNSGLAKALQEAAAAQRKCAEACLAVAAEYERLSQSQHSVA